MPAPTSDLSLSLRLPSFRLPSFEADTLSSADENGLQLYTGGNAADALKSTPINAVSFNADLNGLQHLVPQTITLAYVNLHLVAGMTVNINSNFTTLDPVYDDFGFAYLSGNAGPSQIALLGDAKYVAKTINAVPGNYNKLFTILEGMHTGQHFNVAQTGDYTLVLGVADVGDKTAQSQLAVTDVSIGIAGGSYTVVTTGARTGLRLADGTIFDPTGREYRPDGMNVAANGIATSFSAGEQSLVSALVSIANVQNATQALLDSVNGSGGLLGANAGGTINTAAGGLTPLTTLTTYGGASVATNFSALDDPTAAGVLTTAQAELISQDGGGLISQDGGGLISQDGGGLTATQKAALITQDGGGLITQDGGGLISQDGGGLAGTRGTAQLVLPGSGGGGDIAATDGAGAATSTGIAYATASTTRSYTVTGDPGVAAANAPKPVGEVLVSARNDATTHYTTPAVAGLSDGRYVAVWSDNLFYQDSGGILHNTGDYEIRGQIYNADGTASGGIFNVSPFNSRMQTNPSVTGLSNGRFVVTYSGVDPFTSVYAQFYNADGTQNGSRVQVNATAKATQSVVASLFGGGAVTVFTAPVSGGQKLVAQLLNADGTVQGANFAVGPAAPAFEKSPAAVGLQDGGFVLAFAETQGTGAETDGIYMQRFNSTGVSQGAPSLVNTTIAGLQDAPGVAVLQDGTYVVSWRSEPVNTGSGPATIFAQHYTAAGVAISGEVTVATDALVLGDTPAISALHNGGYAVVWTTSSTTTQLKTLEGQVLSADGTKQGASFAITPATSYYQSNDVGAPAATVLGDDKLLVLGARNDGRAFSDIRSDAFAFPSTPTAPTAHGRGLDGIISGATVFADANGNGVLDDGEASATTDANGRYTFTSPASGVIILKGGSDRSTGLPFTQTYTAPAGSLSVTALSTLVQKVMASTGGTLGDAVARVSVALGLPVNTDITALNPITGVLNGAASQKALIADAVVNNTLALAKAAGAAYGDLYKQLALQITSTPFATVDPTSVSTVEALGLSLDTAFTVSGLAQAGAALLAQKVADDSGSPQALVTDVSSVSKIQQGAEAADLKVAVQQGNTGPLFNTYAGDALTKSVAASSVAASGTPFEFEYTDVTTSTIGYTRGDAYSGPVANLAKQYIWNSTDKVNIATATANVFLHGGVADDALLVTAGTNVLDGSAGSNFLVGGKGASQDTFFVDGRGGLVTWSTIVNFHPGDAATIFGFKSGTSTLPFTAVDGVTGYQGLTIHSELAGAGTGVNASMTFAGITQADADAHFTITADTLAKGTANATDYLLVQYNK